MAKRFLIEKIVPSNNTSAGILLPEVNSGRLVALGPGARDLHGNVIPMVENTPIEANGESVTVPPGPDHRIDVQVEIPETDAPNEGNGESVTVPAGPDHRIDVENPDNSLIEEELAARVKFGRKLGIFVAGTSVAGIVAVFNNSGNYHEKNLFNQLLFGASLLFTLISFLFGMVLLQGSLFRMGNPNSMGRIKFVTGGSMVSMTMVMIFGSALIIRRAY